jgi:ABC-type transport system involved in cytochrome bd biosynthesis fused ATPase/permease subunit
MTETLHRTRIGARLMRISRIAVTLSVVVLFVMANTSTAWAYVGPGAGLGILGTLLAVLIATLASVFGLILWLVRMIKRRKKGQARQHGEADKR